MRTRSSHERRANTRYAGEEWAEDVEMIDADVDRTEDGRCVSDENSDPNVVPPVVTPDGHVDERRRRVYSKKTRPYSKKTRPHVADPGPPADRSGEYLEYLDVGDRTTSCSFCDAPLWELVIWLRQALLLVIGAGLSTALEAIDAASPLVNSTAAAAEATQLWRASSRYGSACLALLVLLAMAAAQERYQPYALGVQNQLARWMYASNALLLLLGRRAFCCTELVAQGRSRSQRTCCGAWAWHGGSFL